MQIVLTSELLIEAYRQGLFPMAYSANSPYVHWICPEQRGQLSIPDLHIPRSLRKVMSKGGYTVTINRDFPAVIRACAQTDETRPETWINENIIAAYIDLHKKGHAHSVEYRCAGEDGAETLAGGLYGVSIGAAFFGESMFSRSPNASKIALVHLVARLWAGGYRLLDTQFVNEHLKQFGAYELKHSLYKKALDKSVALEADFLLDGRSETDLIAQYFTMRRFG